MHKTTFCAIALAGLSACTSPSSTMVPERGYLDAGDAAPAVMDARPAAVARPAPQDGDRKTDLRAGDVEVLVAATGINDEDFENGFGSLGLLGSVYINDDGLGVLVRQTANFADTGPGSDTWNGSTRVGIQQTFEVSQLMPFIGLSVGRTYGDLVDDTWIAGPEAGIKWYLKEEAFLQASVEYQFFFDESDAVEDLAEDGNFIYLLGFGLKF